MPFVSHKCLTHDWGALPAAAGRPRPLAVCLSRLGLPRSPPALRSPVRQEPARPSHEKAWGAHEGHQSSIRRHGQGHEALHQPAAAVQGQDSASGCVTRQRDWVPHVGSLIKKTGLSSSPTSCLPQPCHRAASDRVPPLPPPTAARPPWHEGTGSRDLGTWGQHQDFGSGQAAPQASASDRGEMK